MTRVAERGSRMSARNAYAKFTITAVCEHTNEWLVLLDAPQFGCR